MKHALALVVMMGMINPMMAQQEQDSEIILAFEQAENADILKVYGAFRPDDSFHIINSCEILGWVVIEAKEGQVASKATTKAYVQNKLQDIQGLPEHTWIEDVSKMEVAMMCREAMQQALDPEGN